MTRIPLLLVKKYAVFLFVLRICMLCSFAAAQVSFEEVDLNGGDGLLFSAAVQNGRLSWKNLYEVRLDTNASTAAARTPPRLLTCFPQKLESLQNGKFLQIRNADGVFIYSPNTQHLDCVSSTPSLYPSAAVYARVRGNLTETALSPDGNWICIFRKKNAVSGSLILASTQTGKEFVLVENTDFSFTDIPVLWSPDSATLIYEKQNRLYFIQPKNAFDPALAEERFRSIGQGNISSIAWAGQKNLLYIQGSLIFSISVNELYTRALYSAVLGTGKICGQLPWVFNGREDRFWTDEAGVQIVLVQGGKNIFYFDLADEAHAYASAFLPVQSGAADFSVFWGFSFADTAAGKTEERALPVIWQEYVSVKGERKSSVYALKKSVQTSAVSDSRFVHLAVSENAVNPALSPDRKNLAFCADNVLYIYNLQDWKEERRFSEEKILSFCWKTSSALYVGGYETVRLWNIAADKNDVLFLSSAGNFVWDKTGTEVLSVVQAGTFIYKAENNIWLRCEDGLPRRRQSMNEHRRIISDPRTFGFYKNLLFVRSLKGQSKTLPLLEGTSDIKKGSGQIAVAFEALDNNENTAGILYTLAERGINATFFINGEFMRRFPETVKAVAGLGHECASSFYTAADLLSDDFIIDETFIRRGLARNEDEFFALTGKDLKLLWHPPYGRSSALIEKAAGDSGYAAITDTVYVGGGAAEAENCTGLLPSQSLAGICEKLTDGAVIVLPCGLSTPRCGRYIRDRLEVLINAVLEAGYTIVPVSQLVY